MVIGVGMTLPYIILTSMPNLLKKTPKPGKWMELLKQTIGFILLAIAVKLMAALPADMRMDVIYFSIALAFSVWMWGGWVDFNSKPFNKWLVRILAAALAVISGTFFLGEPKQQLIDWQNYDQAMIEKAKENNRPVLIKFTADWCTTCVVVDRLVFGRQDIAELIESKNVLAVKADTTSKNYQATKDLKEKYNQPAVPVTVLIKPGEEKTVKWPGIAFGNELKEQLKGLQSYNDQEEKNRQQNQS
jgi:thiol:disulfide interchange protein DsbD